jgi:hypothetical protein
MKEKLFISFTCEFGESSYLEQRVWEIINDCNGTNVRREEQVENLLGSKHPLLVVHYTFIGDKKDEGITE